MELWATEIKEDGSRHTVSCEVKDELKSKVDELIAAGFKLTVAQLPDNSARIAIEGSGKNVAFTVIKEGEDSVSKIEHFLDVFRCSAAFD